jgi:serine phosphatase RsbU (regulator of sigma subunit)
MPLRTYATIVMTLFLGVVSTIVTVLGLSAQRSEMYADSIRKLDLVLSGVAELVRTPLETGEEKELCNVAKRISRAEMVSRVLIADADGMIIAGDEETWPRGRLPADWLLGNQGTQVRLVGGKWMTLRSVMTDDVLLGYVHLEIDAEPFIGAVRRMQQRAVIYASSAILAGALLAYLFGGYLGRSFLPLRRALRSARSGDLSARVTRSWLFEVDETGQIYNRMTDKLSQRMREMEEINRLISELSLATSINDVAGLVAETCEQLSGGSCSLWIRSQTTGGYERMPDGCESLRPEHDWIASQVIRENKVVTIGAVDADCPPGAEIGPDLMPDAGVVAPLTAPTYGNVGFMAIAFKPQSQTPDREQVNLALALANAAAPQIAALQRAAVRERAAQTLVEMLLPPPPLDVPILDIAAHYRPAEIASGLGGDYYDFIILGDRKWGFAIGDVAGKGVYAAQFTSMAKYALRAYALEGHSPAHTLDCTNNVLLTQTSIESFITILYLVVDLQSRVITFSNAGHTPGLLYQVDANACLHLLGGGPGAGIMKGIAYSETDVQVRPGDVLVLMTDGVTEARKSTELYGIERAESVVMRYAHATASSIAGALLSDILAFSGGRLSDDVAIVAVKVELPPTP